MKNIKEIEIEIETVDTFKTVCLAFQETSATKMQTIRKLVLETRTFYNKLSEVYYDVKLSYKDKLKENLQEKKNLINKTGPAPEKKKAVAVLLSANFKLYGSIINNVFDLFVNYITNNESDVIIVGRLGRDLYQKLPLSSERRDYLYFEIPDMEFGLEDLRPIIYHLINYKEITVFHGQYRSILKQEGKISNITGNKPMGEITTYHTKKQFLFEPSLDTVLNFFETQIFSSLFKQTVHESELARLASRIKVMQYALENVDKREKTLNGLKSKANKNKGGKKQIERLAGIELWGKLI